MDFLYPEGFNLSGVTALSGNMTVDGDITGDRVFNAVYNDIAEFRPINGSQTPGKCYVQGNDGAELINCSSRNQLGVVGILSDTYGFSLGKGTPKSFPIALAGWVLAHMTPEEEFVAGDVLTNDEDGCLTKMTQDEKINNPERIIATYSHDPCNNFWTPSPKIRISVNERHWVKIR